MDLSILYPKCVWLFIIGGLLGVLFENIWWKVRYGFWQSHYALLWMPLCTIYGFGAVFGYLGAILLAGQNIVLRFLAYVLTGTVIEFIGGFLLEAGLKMRAWDYRGTFLNARGYVNLLMAVIWGFWGLGFELLLPGLEYLFVGLQSSLWWYATLVMSTILLSDTLATAACLIRGSRRHRGIEAKSPLEHLIDKRYDDAKMHHRFINWHFTDEPDTARTKSVVMKDKSL